MPIPYPRLDVENKRTYAEDVSEHCGARHPGNATGIIAVHVSLASEARLFAISRRERIRALPDDGRRYEVLDGELFVSPSPRPDHQVVVLKLEVILELYVKKHALGWVFTSPADLEFSPRRRLQPDVFMVANAGRGRPRVWADARSLSLVVEVKSDATARADRCLKRPIYQNERIPDYWIVDPDARVVERWNPDDERPAIIAETLTWHPKSEVPALENDLPELFASALD